MSKGEVLSQGRHPVGRPTRNRDTDWVAVERACRGEAMPLNPAERRMAVERCVTSLRLSTRETAKVLGLNSRSVSRIRHEITAERYRESSPMRAILGPTIKDGPQAIAANDRHPGGLATRTFRAGVTNG